MLSCYIIKLSKNGKNLIGLLKTFNLYQTDMGYKGKRILRKIAEKLYEEIIDNQEFADDTKKERLSDICNKLKPPNNN